MDVRGILLLGALASVISSAGAASAPAMPGRGEIADILDLQRAIETQVLWFGDALDDARRHAIRVEQRRIRSLVHGKDSLDALTREQRLQLVNAQERINAAMHGTRLAEERRLMCRRERPTGTNVVFDRCITVVQYELQRENAERVLRFESLRH